MIIDCAAWLLLVWYNTNYIIWQFYVLLHVYTYWPNMLVISLIFITLLNLSSQDTSLTYCHNFIRHDYHSQQSAIGPGNNYTKAHLYTSCHKFLWFYTMHLKTQEFQTPPSWWFISWFSWTFLSIHCLEWCNSMYNQQHILTVVVDDAFLLVAPEVIWIICHHGILPILTLIDYMHW